MWPFGNQCFPLPRQVGVRRQQAGASESGSKLPHSKVHSLGLTLFWSALACQRFICLRLAAGSARDMDLNALVCLVSRNNEKSVFRLDQTNSLIGSPVVSLMELAILIGRPIGVMYSLVQSIPKALYTVANKSPMVTVRSAICAPRSSLEPMT